MGASHWLKTLVMLSPLLMGEFIKDAEKRWRYNRIAVIAGTAVLEGLHTHRLQKERDECREGRPFERG